MSSSQALAESQGKPSRKRRNLSTQVQNKARLSIWDKDPQELFNQFDQRREQKKDIFKLDEYFVNNKFFKNLAKDTDRETTYHCYKIMNFQTFYAGETIFHFGDTAFTFYIMLRGEVAVKIPQAIDLEITPDDLFIFCIQFFDDIEWNKFPLGDVVRPEIKSEIQRLGVTFENLIEKIPQIQDKLKKKEFQIPYCLNEVLDGKRLGNIKVWVVKEVSLMGEDKREYQVIVGNAMKRQVNEKVKFFKNFRIFSNLSKNKMQRMLYYFQERQYHRKQVVFMEGIDNTDGVYFIKNGEFEVSKKVKIEKQEDKAHVVNQLQTVNKQLKDSMKINFQHTQQIDISLKQIRLYLQGANEIFGLEEVADNKPKRLTTVVCSTNQATVFYIKKEDFINGVNLFKFSDKILQEKFLKQQLLNLRMGETEVFRLKKEEEFEQTRKQKILERESEKTMLIQVNDEFDQKQFQKATKKLISDKKTLNFSPGLLNQRLKFIKMKGEMERMERTNQNDGFASHRSDEQKSSTRILINANKMDRNNQLSPLFNEKIANPISYQQSNSKSQLAHAYYALETGTVTTKQSSPMTKSIRTYRVKTSKSNSKNLTAVKSMAGLMQSQNDIPLDEEEKFMQIQSLEKYDQKQITQTAFNVPQYLNQTYKFYNKVKQPSWMERPLVQLRQKLKTSLPSQQHSKKSSYTLNQDLQNLKQLNIPQPHLPTMPIIESQPTTEQMPSQRKSVQINQPIQNQKSAQLLTMSPSLLPAVTSQKYLNAKLSQNNIILSQDHHPDDCKTCVFCRKQATRQLIQRPITKQEISKKIEKEKIISFRENLSKKFNRNLIREQNDALNRVYQFY
ncbi:UNKNOWN [Stylonychia lemnae]|uniref:Cyclic nucleotide-binding domain-containing protein n=1 Tax=Stylonychia lemnae TaxID=5949 RepID=A0A078ADE7_STYLE|nr:UNKNOWN [Stylonychia lemnae]|eukprot:CDW80269.1 UNKNOWN [Stylonychia lemnae]